MDLGIGVYSTRSLRGRLGEATLGATGLVAGSLPVALAGRRVLRRRAGVGLRRRRRAVTCRLWVVATVVTTDALRGLARVRRGIPMVVRTASALGGAAIAGAASPVVATGQGPAGPQVLAGLRLPERIAVGPVVAARAPVGSPAVTAVRVVAGDTLRDIATRRLGAVSRPLSSPLQPRRNSADSA